MARQIQRIPRFYDGPFPTARSLKVLLPLMLEKIEERYECDVEHLFSQFRQILGENLSLMVHSLRFNENILYVLVKNSSLYSLLATHEKNRILKELRHRCKSVKIENISFKIG